MLSWVGSHAIRGWLVSANESKSAIGSISDAKYARLRTQVVQ
jgi:hypothetical protein